MNPYQHILTYNGVVKILTSDPAGWKDFTRTYHRDSVYHGILRTEADTQRFVNNDGALDSGGYQFIIDAYYTDGISTEVTYERKILNPHTKFYDDDFIGILDFTPSSGFNITDKWVEVKVMDSSKLQNFKSNEDKKYTLSSLVATNGNSISPFVSAPKLTNFKEHDIFLYAQCRTGSISESEFFEAPNLDELYGFNYYESDPEINLLGDRLKVSETDPKTKQIYINETEETFNITVILTGTYDLTLDFERDTEFGTTRVEYEGIVRKVNDLDITVDNTQLYNGFYLNETISEVKNYTGVISFEQEYVMPPNYSIELFVSGRVQISSINGADVTITSNDEYSLVDVSEEYNVPLTRTNTWLSFETSTRLLQLMTGETDTSKLLDSEVLGRTDSEFTTYPSNGRLSDLTCVGGRVLRGFPDGETKLNFKDWFSSLDKMGNIAAWYDRVNDVFRIEDKEEVYRNDEILNLGTIKDITIRPYQEAYFSEISSGTQEAGDYEDIQGVLEYNIQSGHEIYMPVKDKLDMRVPYNIDTTSMSICMRYGYNSTGLTDKKQDEKLIIVEVDLSSSPISTIQNDELPVIITGFRGIDKRYNGNYTPRTCLKNNINNIGSIMKFGQLQFINFLNNAKDLIISRDLALESDSLGQSEEPLFLPEIYEFETSIDYDVISQIDSDPHGYITFYDESGTEYKGFILTVDIQDWNRIANFTLIRHNTDR